MLSSIFDSDDGLEIQTNRFIKKLNGCISSCFKKVRFNNKYYVKSDKIKVIKDELRNGDKLSEDFSANKLWKLRRKLCNKYRDPPNAMIGSKGNTITDAALILDAAQEAHTNRLLPNKHTKEMDGLVEDKNELCNIRLKSTLNNKRGEWQMSDLKLAIKELKFNKSADPLDLINELFTNNSAGDDLLEALLKLINKIKAEQYLPTTLRKVVISSIYKSKEKNLFDNYRGIFRLPIIRSIIDKLIYFDEYSKVDSNITDCSNGARKYRGVRDNIFIVNSIVNSVINGVNPPIQIEIMDLEKCFDKLWLEASINSLYEYGVQNDNLNLIHNLNKSALVSVKVGNKKSDKVTEVNNVIMQGSILASLQCTVLQDTFNRSIKIILIFNIIIRMIMTYQLEC